MQHHVSEAVPEEGDLVLPTEEATTEVFVHIEAFFSVCARLTGERCVLAGGSIVGWWEMFVVQHWNPVHPDHLSPSLQYFKNNQKTVWEQNTSDKKQLITKTAKWLHDIMSQCELIS